MIFWAVVPVLLVDFLAFVISGWQYSKGLHRFISYFRPLGILSLLLFSKEFFGKIEARYGAHPNFQAYIVIFGSFALIVLCYIIFDLIERRLQKR